MVRLQKLRRIRAGELDDFPQSACRGFQGFCELNTRACPLLAVGEPGDWSLPTSEDETQAHPLFRASRSHRACP